MKEDNIIEQSSKLMNKANSEYVEKKSKEKTDKTIKEVYINNIEDVINRVGLDGVTLESEINIPEIYIDKDKGTRDFIKSLGYINSKPELFGLSIVFNEDTFTTVNGGEIIIDGETYTTHGEDMGVLKVITTINKDVNLEELRKLLLKS